MNKITLAALSLCFISCAHRPQTSEVVQFPYAADLLENVQATASRAPASVEIETEEVKSTRRVYFSALYHQYLTLAQHLNKSADINSCPQFHHDKMATDADMVPELTAARRSSIEENGRAYFPELAFNKKFSLADYHINLKAEVETLCEEGLSDNFYKFDNLVTHYSHKKSFHLKHESMEAVLKIPVFANFYLLKMLQGQNAISFIHPEEKRFIMMTQTQWFERYVAQASRLRNNFIRNKMVQR